MRRPLEVWGRSAGYLEAGRGRPVVLIHGAGSRGEVWTTQLSALDDAARLLAVDLPGHGRTEGPGCSAVGDYARWVLAFLEAAGLDRVSLVGHSMGGAVAQVLALAEPRRVVALGLVGTGARLRVLPRMLELFRVAPPEGRLLLEGLAYSPSTPSGAVTEVAEALRETAPTVVLGDFLACDRFDVTDRVAEIRARTLVVVGEDDRLTPPKYARHLAGVIPGARLAVIPRAGHFPQLEQPWAVNAELRAFLAMLEPLA